MSAARQQRMFFALWPNEAVRSAIDVHTRAVREGSGGRLLPAANLHITLAFLGNISVERVTLAEAAADGVCATSFSLVLDRVEAWRRQALLCLVAEKTPQSLVTLEADLRARLTEAQFELDARAFRPHLTLARNVERRYRPESIVAIDWPVQDFVLVESITSPRGSTYTVRRRWS